ncbi:hypothetical protein SAMN04488074_13828 [Lentzea albidocapillata subsp. violacea]|uniref:Peptide chain release factor 3 n=1 Tax=Lentzea albidocapillata subsp. violacea TaxID=128104 RepID=A0A1G9ZA72_9PSEU|nr:hypothetical protein [Lentzea albidocapillata]SDN18362.1 hypothetical protein SAMN04488074_13828 [Lentzea albidocapillata subsp. violacea]
MAAARQGAASLTDVRSEAARRRAFAVISHPDAGKSTLTGAIALHAVGKTQFDVATYRMLSDYGAPILLDHLEYSVVGRLTDPRRRHELARLVAGVD